MLERSPYPLLTLKLLGSLCPCLEKEEDRAARRAAWSLSSVTVRWHKSLGSGDSDSNASVSGFIKGIFGGSSSGAGTESYESINGASFSIIDARGGPQLVMSPPPDREICKKRIPLRMIKTVRLAGSRSGIEVTLDNNDVVLRFDLLKPLQIAEDDEEGDMTQVEVEDADNSTRNDIMVQLQILVEWERRRQARLITLGFDEDSEDIDQLNDDDMQLSPKKRGIIADRARKVQHFAQREIEMQKQKRDRENRKAKYVKEAGGLKYTAIAMANRS
jgi:hypothetical protein